MRKRTALVAIVLAGIAVAVTGTPAAAPGGPAGRVCTDVRLGAALPAPPDGLITQQSITVDENCVVRSVIGVSST